ncbi:MAG: glycosyltransferase family 4 protein, partial [Candidatus Omnitrophica bacterium]|nr:glycosyltransferase family 4 protein [Candidatus Omnitrophota bacterium]
FKIINDFQPQIIMNHQRNLLSNLYLAFFFYNKVKIYYEHGGNLLSQGSKVTRLFYKLFSWQYRMILTNSNLVKQKIQALKIPDEDKVNVLYLGIDVDKYRKKERNEGFYAKLGLDQKKKIIGAVGRMVEQKGWDDFLSVANEIQLLDQNYQFLIIGDGPLRSELEAKSKEMSLSVMFLGNREDVQDLLQIFDLFMMTSKSEPFGLTVLEALAAEVPIVGYYVDGMGEIFDHGGGGVLLKERNPQKLAQTVIDIFAEEGRLRTFSQEGKKNVECNFDIKTTIRNLEKYYLQLVQ